MKRSRRLLDETGQMSIFVALVFQVLFVFFAMVVNIGLIVHDKINLQNAVDFGAYYAAERQSELMNEIAHINYQIRQDNKLLAWRYRVLGTLGRQGGGPPPQLTIAGTPLADEPYPQPANEPPSICVTNFAWGDVTPQGGQQENYCFRPYNQVTTLVPITPIVAPWVPGVFVQRSAEKAALARQLGDCASTGPKNWFFTMQMLYAYRQSLAVRKEMIYKLRRMLASSDLRDQSLQSVTEGVKQTVRRNLTSTNLEGFDDQSFMVYNSLSHPDCAGPDGDGAPTFVEIPTKPLLWFTNVNGGNACSLVPQTHENLGGIQGTFLYSQALANLAYEPPAANEQNPDHSSLGFEKNPWCVAYMGVRAVSKPRKPFAPFGQPVTLVARAFAQPFGGRIGPWYRNTWSRNASSSDGPNRVDPLTSPRFVGGTLDGTEEQRLPNFSRYPGDQLGLLSKVALGAQRHIIRLFYSSNPGSPRLLLGNYSTFDDLPTTGDPLPINPNDPPNAPGGDVVLIRKAEVAAVSPDIFDTTYYSIDPNWFQNYLQPAQASGLFSGMPAIQGRQPIPISDIGSRMNHPVYNAQTIESQIALSISDGGLDPELLNQELRYYLRDWRHLLTGWTLPKVQTFTFPEATFGKCDQVAPAEVMVPGKCAQKGGRVGYSVRMLSRDYLFSNKWNVGGDGVGPAAIHNPPDPAF